MSSTRYKPGTFRIQINPLADPRGRFVSFHLTHEQFQVTGAPCLPWRLLVGETKARIHASGQGQEIVSLNRRVKNTDVEK